MTDELPRFAPLTDPRPDDTPWPEMIWPPAPDTLMVGRTIELFPLDADRDSAALWSNLADPDVWTHLRFQPTDADSLRVNLRNQEAKGFFIFGVRLRTEVGGLPAGSLVGMTSYLDVSPGDARLEIGGTGYSTDVWATAVNPEAKYLLLEHAFESLNVGRVQIKTDIRNHRSQQAIARLGATYEGILRRGQRRADGTIRDSVIFSITIDDWPAVRARLAARLDY